MTDQDPTQRHDALDAPPPAAPPPAPSAAGGAVDDGPATNTVPTTPVAGTTAGRARGGRLRWIVVAVVTLAVAAAAAGATLLLTGESGDPSVLSYAPANSLTYAEVRLDLPGNQQAELAKVMRAFPGFDDQAAFPTKLNEALDQLVTRASNGKQSWNADIDPWFGRQVSVSMGPLPTSVDAGAKDAHAVLLASVKDAAKAEAWAAKLVSADAGATTSTETYNGITITKVSVPAKATGTPTEAGYAVVGPVLAVGDVASVKAAIDTGGTKGLNTIEQFRTAEASLSGDRLALGYVDVKGFTDAAKRLAASGSSAMPSLPAALDDLSVPWAAAAVRAQDSSFVVETRTPHVQALGPAKSADTTLASVLPPTTVALAEGHDVGEALTRFKDLAAKDPQLAAGVTQLDDTLKLAGGWDAVVGWMGEAGIAVTRDGSTIAGGLVVAPTKAADAQRLLTQLRGFLQLAGGSSGIKVTDETYKDTTITVVDLGNLGSLAGAATGGAVAAPSNLTISYAVTDQVVVLGYGTDFTKAVLDARTGDSLAKSSRFAAARAQVGAAHGSLFWLDVAGIRDLAEGQIPAADKSRYEADVKPYLQAFDSVIGTAVPGTDLDRGTVILRVTGS